MIDELKFDQQFLAQLSLIASGLTLAALFAFRRFMAERSIYYIVGFLTLAGTLLSLPQIGMFYGLHEWTAARTGGVVDARFIAVIDTALESPLGQIAMVPMLAWIANSAPDKLKATYFAVMASFTNLALSASARHQVPQQGVHGHARGEGPGERRHQGAGGLQPAGRTVHRSDRDRAGAAAGGDRDRAPGAHAQRLTGRSAPGAVVRCASDDACHPFVRLRRSMSAAAAGTSRGRMGMGRVALPARRDLEQNPPDPRRFHNRLLLGASHGPRQARRSARART